MAKPASVFHFAGLRRSGNHACINWLANSIYGHPVRYKQLDHYLFRQFPENRIFFINSYAQESALTVFKYVWKYRKEIAQCEHFFLSLEDEGPGYSHFLRSEPGEPRNRCIHIDRSIFNILSSRAKKIEVEKIKEHNGIASNFNVDDHLLGALLSYRLGPLIQWHYDQWLVDPKWRNAFLERVGLQHDIMPEMSVEAGGSSFGDKDSDRMSEIANARYKAGSIPFEWMQLIESKFIEQLSSKEQAQLQEIREGM